ncbi:MAG: triple tyrosine motif-containing protein, partial [Halioglobus sp.]|nr:triple tyrosine motif-containing protein [Halioglobus sp.]
LDFANPDQNRYTHILEGLDSGWVDDGTNNKITYTNLEPGDYVFRARGANSAGIWSKDGVSLKIKVLPPWWLTWWAYCLYSAILLIAIWGAMRIYREHLLKEEAIKNAGEMLDAADRARDDLQESHELQDNLVRAVHQHNVATLDLVGKYLGSAEVAGESRPKVLGQLKAMELLEKCFYFQGGLLMADVHTYVDSLTNYLLDLTPVDPAKITTINLTTSELLPATIASPAAVILYELLENSLSHAFTDDRAAQFIEIDAKVDRSMHDQRILLLSVSDDGVGLSATQSERSHNKAGLQIVRSLADSMGGAVTISQNDGSQFHVSLPMP